MLVTGSEHVDSPLSPRAAGWLYIATVGVNAALFFCLMVILYGPAHADAEERMALAVQWWVLGLPCVIAFSISSYVCLAYYRALTKRLATEWWYIANVGAVAMASFGVAWIVAG